MQKTCKNWGGRISYRNCNNLSGLAFLSSAKTILGVKNTAEFWEFYFTTLSTFEGVPMNRN